MSVYVVPFLRYSASKNGVHDLETVGRGRSRSLKTAPFDRYIRLSIGWPLYV